jgi:DNA-directed RNA polymerase subunit M/transcription elongation factor TFIIS
MNLDNLFDLPDVGL